jgi:hypothetical protein
MANWQSDAPSILSRRHWILLAGAGLTSWSNLNGFGGQEFWETKDPAEWNADEIAKLLMKSPWAKAVSAERVKTQKNSGPVGMGGPRTRIPGSSRTPSTRTVTTYQGTVVWESAAPVRAALKTKLPDGFEGQYVLGVSGVPLAKSESKGAMDRLRQVTTLQIKNRLPLEAAGVQVQHENGTVYLFGFSREGLALSGDSKEMVFTTHMGNTLFTAKFNPKDMLYHGELSV